MGNTLNPKKPRAPWRNPDGFLARPHCTRLTSRITVSSTARGAVPVPRWSGMRKHYTTRSLPDAMADLGSNWRIVPELGLEEPEEAQLEPDILEPKFTETEWLHNVN